MSPEMIVTLLVGLVCGAIGAAIGSKRNRTGFGFVVSFIVGPIGWAILLLLPNNWPKCPSCKGDVVPGAKKCKNCGSDLASA